MLYFFSTSGVTAVSVVFTLFATLAVLRRQRYAGSFNFVSSSLHPPLLAASPFRPLRCLGGQHVPPATPRML